MSARIQVRAEAPSGRRATLSLRGALIFGLLYPDVAFTYQFKRRGPGGQLETHLFKPKLRLRYLGSSKLNTVILHPLDRAEQYAIIHLLRNLLLFDGRLQLLKSLCCARSYFCLCKIRIQRNQLHKLEKPICFNILSTNLHTQKELCDQVHYVLIYYNLSAT